MAKADLARAELARRELVDRASRPLIKAEIGLDASVGESVVEAQKSIVAVQAWAGEQVKGLSKAVEDTQKQLRIAANQKQPDLSIPAKATEKAIKELSKEIKAVHKSSVDQVKVIAQNAEKAQEKQAKDNVKSMVMLGNSLALATKDNKQEVTGLKVNRAANGLIDTIDFIFT